MLGKTIVYFYCSSSGFLRRNPEIASNSMFWSVQFLHLIAWNLLSDRE